MSCQERAGFLFSHDCEEQGMTFCVQCHKLVCPKHTRQLPQGAFCVTCARTQPAPAPAAAAGVAAGAAPAAATRSWDDDPYLYGDSHFHDYHSYDADDRKAFQKPASAGGAGIEADIGGS